MVSAETEQIRVAVGRSDLAIPRLDVRRVLTVRRRTAEGAGRGFLIGAAGGALQGALLTRNRAVFAALFGVGWGAIGAFSGAVNGFGEPELVVIYLATTGGSAPQQDGVGRTRE